VSTWRDLCVGAGLWVVHSWSVRSLLERVFAFGCWLAGWLVGCLAHFRRGNTKWVEQLLMSSPGLNSDVIRILTTTNFSFSLFTFHVNAWLAGTLANSDNQPINHPSKQTTTTRVADHQHVSQTHKRHHQTPTPSPPRPGTLAGGGASFHP
jgi:hypothetical protein